MEYKCKRELILVNRPLAKLTSFIECFFGYEKNTIYRGIMGIGFLDFGVDNCEP